MSFKVHVTVTGSGTVTPQYKNSGGSYVTFDPENQEFFRTTDFRFIANPSSGYSFYVWSTGATTSQLDIQISTENTINATFTANTYTATFDARGGTASYSTKTCTYNTAMGALPTLTAYKPGYNINTDASGYFWRERGNVGYVVNPNTIYSWTTGKTFEAHWMWRITYNPNGGSGSTTYSDYKAEGESNTIVTTSSTRSGYRFIGWNTAADGTGDTYTVGQSYGGPNITLYAQWKPVAHKSNSNNWNATPVYKRVNGQWVEIKPHKRESGEWVDV